MDIKQLSYFVNIYKCHSFTQAAKNCFISPQGVSLSMSRLEDELGVKLFERLPHGVHTTKEADFLYLRAEKILQLIEECEAHYSLNRGSVQEFPVMFVRGTVERFARNAISRFRKKFPQISVVMRVGTDQECEEAIRNGDVFVGVYAGPPDAREVSAKLVYSGKNVLIVHRDSPLYHKASIKVEDLEKVPLAIQEPTTNSTAALLSLCRKAGIHLSYLFCDEPRSALIMAEMGMCCGMTNNISAEKLCTTDLRVVPFESSEMDWNVFCCHKKDAVLTPQIRYFEYLLTQASK